MISRLGDSSPEYSNLLARLLIFREGNTPVHFSPVLRHTPYVTDLTLFGWECVRVDPGSWVDLSRNLVTLEIVGLGFNSLDIEPAANREAAHTFNCQLFSEARQLRTLKVAGWGDTQLQVDELLHTLPLLHTLYLEDIKINVQEKVRGPGPLFIHQLSSLSIFHCSTRAINLVQLLATSLPDLAFLSISSLYLDHPNRGLPFHFHLPRADMAEITKHPVADLTVLAELEKLEVLRLNVSYPQEHLEHDFNLPVLLIRKFPMLRSLHLDNYISRRGSVLSYTFDKVRSNNRLQWFLDQYNRDIKVDLS